MLTFSDVKKLRYNYAFSQDFLMIDDFVSRIGLSISAWTSYARGWNTVPRVADSPSVKLGKATILTCYWIVEKGISESKYEAAYGFLETGFQEIWTEAFSYAFMPDMVLMWKRVSFLEEIVKGVWDNQLSKTAKELDNRYNVSINY